MQYNHAAPQSALHPDHAFTLGSCTSFRNKSTFLFAEASQRVCTHKQVNVSARTSKSTCLYAATCPSFFHLDLAFIPVSPQACIPVSSQACIPVTSHTFETVSSISCVPFLGIPIFVYSQVSSQSAPSCFHTYSLHHFKHCNTHTPTNG